MKSTLFTFLSYFTTVWLLSQNNLHKLTPDGDLHLNKNEASFFLHSERIISVTYTVLNDLILVPKTSHLSFLGYIGFLVRRG